MAKRIDVRRAILEACDDLLDSKSDHVDDIDIAKLVGIDVRELRRLLREMDEDRLVSLIALKDRFKVTIEPGGRLYLFQRITRSVRRRVLQTCVELASNAGNFFEDVDVASRTGIRLSDVRICLACMLEDGYVDLGVAPKRKKAANRYAITPVGRLKYRIYQPFPDEITDDERSSEPQSTAIRERNPSPALDPQAPMGPSQSTRTILFLGANPKDTAWLQLGREVRQIEKALERAKNRDHFHLFQKWAVTDDDLRRALLDHRPEIVHFSGHGSGLDGIIFEDDQGRTHKVTGATLARFFKLCSKYVKCVVLNACYTKVQATAISQYIEYVIGMKQAIGDEAAIKFSVGFYDALGAGEDFDTAFQYGQNAIDLKKIPEYLTPVLKKRS